MITIRKSEERGRGEHGWLDARHSFSFAGYFDPRHLGFRTLRVINEDRVAPGAGFPEHPHDNMEIVTYIVSGALAHADSEGHQAVIRPGDVQHMTAGAGIEHSEFNPSNTEPVHLLQIWIKPGKRDLEPAYHQEHFDEAARSNRLRLVASPDGADGSIPVQTDARIFASILEPGKAVTHALASGRHAWLQLVRGELDVNGQQLKPGDGAAVSNERELKIAAGQKAEFLLFDLP